MTRLARGEVVYPRLREIQARDGFVSASSLEALARELSLPLHYLQGLVSFYSSFHTEPPKPRTVRVCRDLSCHLAGAQRLLAQERRAAAGHDDTEVSTAPCLGRCELAPAVEVNGRVRGQATQGDSFPQGQARSDPYASEGERYGVIRGLLAGAGNSGAGASDPILSVLQESGLRGMGGAGFPTALKWRTVRDAPATPKYVVCNADESEPGTSKDRVILERWPHLVLEGILIGMWTVGAEEAWIYLRHEYLEPARALEEELRRARASGLLDGGAGGGAGPAVGGGGRRLEVRIFESPGGYICGEETALLEALEGKRAEPRNRPPFPAVEGLWGRPTVINNVETFALVPGILKRGAAWFASQGENGAKGLKFLALSGHVQRPGVYEVPLGIRARRLIDEFGLGVRGAGVKAFAPGGASSGFLPASDLDTPLEFKALADKGSMLGSGAVVVAAEGTDMGDLALNVLRFFRDESCGKCVPCREGTAQAVAMVEVARGGRGQAPPAQVLDELNQAMALTSICGLGQVALNPLLSVMRYWPEEWARAVER